MPRRGERPPFFPGIRNGPKPRSSVGERSQSGMDLVRWTDCSRRFSCPSTGSRECERMSHEDSLRLEQARHVDAVCGKFEAAWKAGTPPEVSAYLGDTPEPERTVLLRELQLLDAYYRQRRGATPVPTLI